MLMFSLENSDPLLNAIYVLSRFGENAILECSPSMFSLTLLHHFLEMNVSFQMMPQFFNRFFSNKTHSSKTLILPLFNTLKRMRESQITSLSFFVLELLDRLVLKFFSPRYELPLIRKFGRVSGVKKDLGNVDLEVFVSIDSLQFRHIIKECRDFFVSVTPTHSDVKFSSRAKEFIFAREGGECVAESETDFLIPAYPLHIFYNITFLSQRVWLFKSVDKLGTFVIAPVGLFAQFSIYFPLP